MSRKLLAVISSYFALLPFVWAEDDGAITYASPEIGDAAIDSVNAAEEAKPATAQEKPVARFKIDTVVAEFEADAFNDLMKEIQFEPDPQGGVKALSAASLSTLPDFVRQRQEAGRVRMLSRPQLAMLSGQPAQLQVGGQVPFVKPTLVGDVAVDFKPFGLEAEFTIQPTSADSCLLEWDFTLSERVLVKGSQGVRSKQGIDGVSEVKKGDGIIAGIPRRDDKWLVVIMQPDQFPASSSDDAPAPASESAFVSRDEVGRTKDLRGSEPAMRLSKDVAKSGSVNHVRRRLVLSPSSRKLKAVEGEMWRLKAPLRIKSVLDFSRGIVEVNSVQGLPDELNVKILKSGTTQLRLGLEDDSQLIVRVHATADLSELDYWLKRLYPDRELTPFELNSTVLLRGTVASERESREIAAIAQRFCAKVLNQLTLSPDLESSETSSVESSFEHATPLAGKQMELKLSPGQSRSFQLLLGHTYEIPFTDRIREVSQFDDQIVKVSPRSNGLTLTLYAEAVGMTEVLFEDASGTTYSAKVAVQDDVSHVHYVLKELYPGVELSLYPLKGALLVRGRVSSEQQQSQIVEVLHEFYPTVLNQLRIVSDAEAKAEASETLSDSAASTSRSFHQASSSKDEALKARSSKPSDENDVDAIRAEVRALHDDVRELLDILRAKSNPKAESHNGSAEDRFDRRAGASAAGDVESEASDPAASGPWNIRDPQRIASEMFGVELGQRHVDVSPDYNGGILTSRVHKGSPADVAGIRKGDVLVGLNQYETLDDRNLLYIFDRLEREQVGDVPFVVYRPDKGALFGTMVLTRSWEDLWQYLPDVRQPLPE